MKPKLTLSKDPLSSWYFRQFEEFTKGWPDKRELDRILFSFKHGWMYLGNQYAFPALVEAALYPGKLKSMKHLDLFFTLYKKAPDYVLALLQHLRAVTNQASKIRTYLLQHGDAEKDSVIAKALGLRTDEAVRKERQALSKLEASLERAREDHDHELESERNRGEKFPVIIIDRRPKGTKRKKNSL